MASVTSAASTSATSTHTAAYGAAFLALLALQLALELGLGIRQRRWVARCAAQVPDAFAAAISLEDHQRAARYTIARQRLATVDSLVSAAAFLVLTWGGLLQALAGALAAQLGHGWAADLTLVAMVFVLVEVLALPLAWWRQFRLEQAFGFNRLTLALFIGDTLKAGALSAVIGLPVLAAVLASMRAAGAHWWLLVWALWCLLSLGLSLAYPRWIAPLFNRFTPLTAGPVQEHVRALLQRTGFSSGGVYTMDGSRRSSHGNAYFTGLGASRRIVFYDTLLAQLSPEEIAAVLAHELGHCRLHHVARQLVSSLAGAGLWLALLAWLQTQAWFGPALGMAAPAPLSDGALLVLFALVAPRLAFLLTPLRSAVSRRHEFAADAFAAKHVGSAALARALIKLYQNNAATLTPDPLHSAFYDSHPPAAVRIERLLAGAPAAAA